MGAGTLSRDAFRCVADHATVGGKSATHDAEQRHKRGEKLHELVDPKGYGVIRRSRNRFIENDGHFVLSVGVALLLETRLDTTGSMGGNVDIAMKNLPHTYELLVGNENSVLSRYDLQMITAIFGDVTDAYVLQRSQAEMDVKIAEQMTYMVPEKQGDDFPEDPHYGIFGAAYLTDTSIRKYGLKHYDFTLTDAPARSRLDPRTLKRVFGDSVFEKVVENGHVPIDQKEILTADVVRDLLKIAHAFVLVVEERPETISFWTELYGEERVVLIPGVRLLPETQAAIIGLTEGTLTLQTLEAFLTASSRLSVADARAIKRAVAGIPIGAQMAFENFDRLPLKGALFAQKTDVWPMETLPEETNSADDADKSENDIWL